ncbi:MAG: cell envelope integrity protein CreD [Candidatus Eutrophobiaceae bacterium]
MASFFLKKPSFKILFLGVLALLLLIPASMVTERVYERQNRHQQVVDEIGEKWGGRQIVSGPFIEVPYIEQIAGQDSVTRHLHFLPEELVVSSDISTEVRYRGIYEAVVYTAKLEIEGHWGELRLPKGMFQASAAPDGDANNPEVRRKILWDEAQVVLGVQDLKGVRGAAAMRISGIECQLNSGVGSGDVVQSAVQCPFPEGIFATDAAPAMEDDSFHISLQLNGSGYLGFHPFGENTRVEMRSSWPSPKFDGAFLPEERTISEAGFSAQWQVSHLNHRYPQVWSGKDFNLAESKTHFGVELRIPNDMYAQCLRMANNTFLFIVFTFIAFFARDVVSGGRVHLIQYVFVGLALIMFFLLLLALSEHIRFGLAYLLSAVAVSALVGLYAVAIAQHRKFAMAIVGILLVLYTWFYILLQIEDHALLVGSIGLFSMLAGLMYVTRRIDWDNASND